jgi:hypothetical protein
LASVKRDMVSCDAPDISRCMLWRVDVLSELLRGAGLRARNMLMFSWPGPIDSNRDEGVELPGLDAALRARLEGLFGEVRCRENGLDEVAGMTGLFDDLADRSDNFTLGRKGVARGDCA